MNHTWVQPWHRPRDIHTTMVGLSERAARPLFAIRDQDVREKVISHVEIALKRTTPTGGKYTKKLTNGEVYIPLQQVRRSARAPRAGPAMYHGNKAYRLRIRPDLAARVCPGFPWMNHQDWLKRQRRLKRSFVV
jgi:hypothetical protein